MFMQGANKNYKSLLNGIDNDFTLGDDRYPETIEEALQVMSEFGNHNIKHKNQSVKREESSAVSFGQMTKAEMMSKGLCFKCGEHRHRAMECKNDKKKEEPTEETKNTKQQSHLSWSD